MGQTIINYQILDDVTQGVSGLVDELHAVVVHAVVN